MTLSAVLFLLTLAVPEEALALATAQLAHPNPEVRSAATTRLLAARDEAERYLAGREFADPEVRRRVQRILHLLQRPRLEIRTPNLVGATEPFVEIQLVVTNPGPSERDIANVWATNVLTRKKQTMVLVVANPAWRIRTSFASGPAPWTGAEVPPETLTIPPRGRVTIPLRFKMDAKRAARYTINVNYVHPQESMRARAAIVVVDDASVDLLRLARSKDKERRALFLEIARRRIRQKEPDPRLERALKEAIRRGEPEMRLEAIKILGRSGKPQHARELLRHARSSVPAVSRASFEALVVLHRLGSADPDFLRLVTRSLGSGKPWPREFVAATVKRSLRKNERYRFYAQLLEASRSARVHGAIVSILAEDGIKLRVDRHTGRVFPRERNRLAAAK